MTEFMEPFSKSSVLTEPSSKKIYIVSVVRYSKTKETAFKKKGKAIRFALKDAKGHFSEEMISNFGDYLKRSSLREEHLKNGYMSISLRKIKMMKTCKSEWEKLEKKLETPLVSTKPEPSVKPQGDSVKTELLKGVKSEKVFEYCEPETDTVPRTHYDSLKKVNSEFAGKIMDLELELAKRKQIIDRSVDRVMFFGEGRVSVCWNCYDVVYMNKFGSEEYYQQCPGCFEDPEDYFIWYERGAMVLCEECSKHVKDPHCPKHKAESLVTYQTRFEDKGLVAQRRENSQEMRDAYDENIKSLLYPKV